jgi:hypothetical protein
VSAKILQVIFKPSANPCFAANVETAAIPAVTNTNEPTATQRAASLSAVPELAEPEPATPEAIAPQLDIPQPSASSPSQEALDSLLYSLPTDEQRTAAGTGWVHAATNATHEALLKQHAGRKLEQIAADKGWKTWKMEDAHNRDFETFWCEKAPECILDQYLKADSRPCVSNYFGRNKRNTARIPNMITWCRKHYQRSGYRGRKNPSNNLEWPREKAGLILEQLRRNETSYFQDTSEHLEYTVSLKKSEQDRVNYHNNHQGQSPDPDPKAKSFEAPVSVLLHIFNTYVGEHKSYQDCCALTDWAESQLSKETCPDLPLWEMVPEYPDFEYVSGDEEEDEDGDDDDKEDEDDAGSVTSKKRSPKKATPGKATPKKKFTPRKSTPRNSTPKKVARSPLVTRASSAKKGRITEQGSIKKSKAEEQILL